MFLSTCRILRLLAWPACWNQMFSYPVSANDFLMFLVEKVLDPVTNKTPLVFMWLILEFFLFWEVERSFHTLRLFQVFHPGQSFPLTPSVWYPVLSARLSTCLACPSSLLYPSAAGICFSPSSNHFFFSLFPLCKMYGDQKLTWKRKLPLHMNNLVPAHQLDSEHVNS